MNKLNSQWTGYICLCPPSFLGLSTLFSSFSLINENNLISVGAFQSFGPLQNTKVLFTLKSSDAPLYVNRKDMCVNHIVFQAAVVLDLDWTTKHKIVTIAEYCTLMLVEP